MTQGHVGAWFVTVTKTITYAVIAESEEAAKALAVAVSNGGPTHGVKFIDKDTIKVEAESMMASREHMP